MSEDIITSQDDMTCDWGVGEVVTIKGKLDAVIFGTPSICIAFPDWTLIYVHLASHVRSAALKPVRIGSYVTVKARVVDEDCTLEAIALWEQGGVPIALSRDVTEELL